MLTILVLDRKKVTQDIARLQGQRSVDDEVWRTEDLLLCTFLPFLTLSLVMLIGAHFVFI